jgi:hypothetical protein
MRSLHVSRASASILNEPNAIALCAIPSSALNNKKSVEVSNGGELYVYSPLSPNVRVPPNAVLRFGGSIDGIETIVISSPSASSTYES